MIALNLLSHAAERAIDQCRAQSKDSTIVLKAKIRPLSVPKRKVQLPKVVVKEAKPKTCLEQKRPRVKKRKLHSQIERAEPQSNIKKIVSHTQLTPEPSQKHYLVTDGSEELVLRQKAIQQITRKKNVNEEIQDLKKLEEQLLMTYQGVERQAEEEKIDNILKERRQQIYKKIYDNVKLISGVQKQEELQKQRDEDILNFLSRQTQAYKLKPHIQQQLLEAKHQIEELKSLEQSRQPSSHRLGSSHNSPNHPSTSNKINLSELFIQGIKSVEKSPPKRQSSRKITRPPTSARKQTASPFMFSKQEKQIDQELLHILLTRWKSIKQNKSKRVVRRRLFQSIDETKRRRFKIIASKLLAWLQKMNRCQITLKMLAHHRFPTVPYSIDGSFVFLRNVKFQNLTVVKELVERNRYLLFEFNHVGQTCLHIAAKYKSMKILRYLIQHGADYEARDLMGRTPLFYAVQAENREAFRLLLYTGAVPWNIQTGNEWFTEMLRKVRKIHTIISISPISVRKQILELELDKLL